MKSISILGRLALACALLAAVAACGQRGPLYMPGSTPPKATKKSDPVQLPHAKPSSAASAKSNTATPSPETTDATDKP